MSREALVLLVCCCDFRDGAERLIPSKSLRNAVIRAFPGLFCILRMCAPRRAAAVVRPRERKKSADRRRRILISRLLIIRASVPRRKSPFPAYFKGFPVVSPLIPPYPAFLKYPVSPQPPGAEEARRCRGRAPAGRHEVAGSRLAQRWRCGTLPWICQAGKRADLRQSAWRGTDTVRKYIKCCTGLYTKSGCGRESRRPISEERRGSFEFLEKERR